MARKSNPQTRLAMNWHLDVIAVKLTAVREGRIRRLVLSVGRGRAWFEKLTTGRARSLGISRRYQGGTSADASCRPSSHPTRLWREQDSNRRSRPCREARQR
jgi:hypothetical protein